MGGIAQWVEQWIYTWAQNPQLLVKQNGSTPLPKNGESNIKPGYWPAVPQRVAPQSCKCLAGNQELAGFISLRSKSSLLKMLQQMLQ
jgi:hypothetical protein